MSWKRQRLNSFAFVLLSFFGGLLAEATVVGGADVVAVLARALDGGVEQLERVGLADDARGAGRLRVERRGERARLGDRAAGARLDRAVGRWVGPVGGALDMGERGRAHQHEREQGCAWQRFPEHHVRTMPVRRGACAGSVCGGLRDHEHRQARVVVDAGRDGAEQVRRDAAATARAEHEDVGADLVGRPEDLLGGVAGAQQRRERDVVGDAVGGGTQAVAGLALQRLRRAPRGRRPPRRPRPAASRPRSRSPAARASPTRGRSPRSARPPQPGVPSYAHRTWWYTG